MAYPHGGIQYGTYRYCIQSESSQKIQILVMLHGYEVDNLDK